MPAATDTTFQARVAPWMHECFGPEIGADVRERGDRFLEEAMELLQAHDYDPGRVAILRDYVWGRPVGEPQQEVGGVMVTLAAYCLATGVDMHQAGEAELARIWTKVEPIRAKQASKRGLHTLVPVPPAVAHSAPDRAAVARAVHRGRYPADREPEPWETADRAGQEYCLRIADSVLELLEDVR